MPKQQRDAWTEQLHDRIQETGQRNGHHLLERGRWSRVVAEQGCGERRHSRQRGGAERSLGKCSPRSRGRRPETVSVCALQGAGGARTCDLSKCAAYSRSNFTSIGTHESSDRHVAGDACAALSAPTLSRTILLSLQRIFRFTQSFQKRWPPIDSACESPVDMVWSISPADTKRDQQIYKWLATNEEIPEEVLLEALRQQSEYDARCRGEPPKGISPAPAEQSSGHAVVSELCEL